MFLTKEDPRAFIKGSRDPLGIQPIWYRLGRHVIANLTTQSNSVRGFTILLLGRYLTERLLADGIIEDDAVVNVFLHTEQIGAYVRHLRFGVEGDIRGIDRVRDKSGRSTQRIPISAGAEGKILSDQKLYGLWGLFSSPARVSGLIEEGPIGITPATRDFVETNYWPHLKGIFRASSGFLRDGGFLNAKNPDPNFRAFSKVLSERFSNEERTFYEAYLRDGVHVSTHPLKHQPILVQLMREHVPLDVALGRDEFQQLRDLAKTRDEQLHRRLDQIVRAESVFSLAMTIFDFLLSMDGQSISDIGRMLCDKWGTDVPHIDTQSNFDLLDEIRVVYPDSDAVGHFDHCQRALQEGRFEDVLTTLVAWNKLTQARRGAAPWLRIGGRSKLEVRFRSPPQTIPPAEDLLNLWRYSYFLPSLQNITRQLNQESA